MIDPFGRGLGLTGAALPALERLVQPDETVLLSRRFGQSILVLARVQHAGWRNAGPGRNAPLAESEFGIPIDRGTVLPIHRGATAQAMLAFLPRSEVDLVLGGPDGLGMAQAGCLDEEKRLLRQLAIVQKCGFAISWDEFGSDHSSVAVPIHTESGTVRATLTIIAPSNQLTPTHASDYARRLNVAAEIIGTHLAALAA